MKILKLNAMERILLTVAIDAAGKKGESLSQLSRLMKLSDKIAFTDEERKILGLRSEDGQVKWNHRKDGKDDGEIVDVEKEIELSDEQGKLLYDVFKAHDEAKQFSKDGLVAMLKVAEQLEYKVE